jgi:hypothetical protein
MEPDGGSPGTRRGRLGVMRAAPKTLWAYAVLVIGTTVFSILSYSEHVAIDLPIALAVDLLLLGFLLVGSRVAWTILILFEANGLVLPAIFDGYSWQAIFVVAGLACLLAPASLRYVWRRHARPGAQATWDAGDRPDSARPTGWYVDPDAPGRMRRWSAEEGRWSGTTRTPRKIEAAWRAGRARASGEPVQRSWNPRDYPDSARPVGWYVNPGAPARMDYWDPAEARWSGKTKTPRKIRRAWEARRAG